MPEPHARKTRKELKKILAGPDRKKALARIAEIPPERLIGPLFSCFFHRDECIRFRSIAVMGITVTKTAQASMEKARIILRRIMWNLNDESGGIGWGSAEAMGEILYHSPELAREFKNILFSYLDDNGNFLEHEMLQRGLLWGIGTYLKADPAGLDQHPAMILSQFLDSCDPVKRAYALRALKNAECLEKFMEKYRNLEKDFEVVNLFNGWDMIPIRIADMIHDSQAGTGST